MKKIILIMICILAGISMSSFASVTETQTKINQLENELNNLQSQVASLKHQVKKTKYRSHNKRRSSNHNGNSTHSIKNIRTTNTPNKHLVKMLGGKKTVKTVSFGNSVVIAPFTERQTFNTGSALLVNSPSINEDSKLLFRRQLETISAKDHGITAPKLPRLVLSGTIQGQVDAAKRYDGVHTSDIDLTSAELDTFAEITNWVNGFMALAYENSAGSSPRNISNSRLKLSKGFIVIGNFNKSPFYGSVGQEYVPFGRYASNMITSPVTKYIGKTKARTIIVGYVPELENAPYARLFIFKGDSKYGNSNIVKNGGFDIGYRWSRNNLLAGGGISYIQNIADSEGMQNTGSSAAFNGFDNSTPAGSGEPNFEKLTHRVGGADIHANVSIDKFSIVGEYVSALTSFGPEDLSYNSHGAKPSAFNLEGAYAFNLFNHPSSVALGYGRSYQSLALNMPKHRFAAVFTTTVLDNLEAQLELRHDVNYGSGDSAYGQGSIAFIPSELGKTNNAITAKINVYF